MENLIQEHINRMTSANQIIAEKVATHF